MVGIAITAIICGTLIILAGIGAWNNRKQKQTSTKIADAIISNLNRKI